MTSCVRLLSDKIAFYDFNNVLTTAVSLAEWEIGLSDTFLFFFSNGIELNSSAGNIELGNDNDTGTITIGSAGARTLSIGSAASAALNLDGGVGNLTAIADAQWISIQTGI